MRAGLGDGFYMVYFQQPGVADAELNADPRRTLRMLLYSASGDAPNSRRRSCRPAAVSWTSCQDPAALPAWLTEDDLDAFVGGLRPGPASPAG